MSQEQIWIIKADGTPTFVYDFDMQEGDRLATPEEILELTKSTPAELNRIQEILTELDKLDIKSIRPLRALAFNDVNEEDKQKLIEYREQVLALRDELAHLEDELASTHET